MRSARAIAKSFAFFAMVISLAAPARADTAPPFDGTVWLGTNLITPSSPSDLISVTPAGQGVRKTYDRRIGWVTQNAYLFNATFNGSLPEEIIVNSEFGSTDAAMTQAQYFARITGQLPRSCRTQIDALWIHAGNENVGGGNRSLMLYSGYAAAHGGYMEEAMLHECAHTSLDYGWKGSLDRTQWNAAAAQDPGFISKYARDNPTSEDVSESFGPYVAWKLGAASGYSADQLAAIASQIPHRLAYLDSQGLDLAPVLATAPSTAATAPAPAPAPKPGSPCPKASLGQRVTTAAVGTLQCRRMGATYRWQRTGQRGGRAGSS